MGSPFIVAKVNDMMYHCITVSVPALPRMSSAVPGTRKPLGTGFENKQQFWVAGSETWFSKIHKLAVFCGIPVPAFPIERGVSSGPPLSLSLGGRKDSDHADDEFSNRSRSLNAPAPPSGTTSTVGCRGSLAGIAASRRKPSSTPRARSPRAPLFRTDRADLGRGCPVAFRFRSRGAAANRPASPRTPTFSGGYSHD